MQLICASLLVFIFFFTGCHTSYESWALSHGAYHWRKGNYKETIYTFENLLKHNPHNADAHMWLALTYEDLEDYEKAKEYYSKAVELDPRYALVYDVGSNKIESPDVRRGWRELDRSDYDKRGFDEAIKSFNLALKKNPQSTEAYIGLATLWSNKKDYEKAIEYLSKAIEIEPNPGHFWVRAEVWRKKKDFERALEDYNKVLEIIPADDLSPSAVHARKIALEAIGNLQKKLKKT